MNDWSDQALAMGQPTTQAPAQGADWADAALAMKPGKQLTPLPDLRKPSGLTLFMDPSKFAAIGSGLSQSVPAGPDTGYQSIIDQLQGDAKLHPRYATAGKALGTGLLGAAGGVEAPFAAAGSKAPLLAPLLTNMAKAGGLAEASQGGSAIGQEAFPNSKIAPIIGGLIAPLGLAGATAGLKNMGTAAMSSLAPKTAESDALQTLSTSQGIPLSLGDTTGSMALNKVETALESTPFSGMLKFRQGQQDTVKQGGANILQSAQAKVPDAFGDLNGQIQAAVTKTMQTNKSQARTLYSNAESLSPAAPVKLTNLRSAAEDNVSTFNKNPDVDTPPPWIAKVQKFETVTPRSYAQVMALRQSFGKYAADAGPGTAESAAWTNMRSALDKDTDAFGALPENAGTPFGQAQASARQFYKENVVPFKDRTLGNVAYGNTDSDTLINKFVQPNRPNLVSKIMDNMDDQGKNALMLGVLKKGFGTANLESDAKPYSAKNFTSYWNKLGTTKDVVFQTNPQLKQQIDGYAKLVDALPSPVSNPPTGARNTPWLAGGALLTVAAKTGVLPAAGLVATGNGLTRMLTQPWGQRLLLTAANSNDPGLLKRLAASAGSQLQATMANPGSAGASVARTQAPALQPQ